MLLSDFLSNKDNAHTKQGNPKVRCNMLSKTKESFNCYLIPSQAVGLARNLLQKAQLIVDEELKDAAVHLWNTGTENEYLRCGLNKARKGPRRLKKQLKAVPLKG
jgi:hypothetical protein